jgi:DNA-binding NarL/FixJ family response regulator
MAPPSSPIQPIRVVVVSDVRLYCEGLAAVLPRERLVVAGTARSRVEAAAAVQSLQPDIVLVDVALAERNELMRQLRSDQPRVQLIAFAVSEDVHTIIECAEAGAVAYVAASAGVQELVTAIEDAAGGELRCSPRIAGELFRRAGDSARSGSKAQRHGQSPVLTERERDVLAMLRQALSNKEIASALNISEATVKNHVHHLLDKLDVPNRVRAAACLPDPRVPARPRRPLRAPASPAAGPIDGC